MIRKVAVVQALREAFPTTLGGMYSAEEVGKEEPEDAGIPAAPISPETGEVLDAEIVTDKKADPEPAPAEESLI
jgi:hypothetical protein